MLSAIKKQLVHVARTVRHAVRSTGGAKRSSHWPKVSKAFLQEHPYCAACGGTEKNNIHHMKPFHLDATLELDVKNLITLCMAKDRHCHLMIGHGDDFKAFNEKVAHDAALALAARKRGEHHFVSELETKIKKERKYA
jgi:5-methylcytosine-specific restriction protein A